MLTNDLTSHLDEIVVEEAAIQIRIVELGREISESYREDEEIVLLVIINGAIPFAGDLMRQIRQPLELDCIRVSSYRDSDRPETAPEIIDRVRLNLRGRKILLIDDIFDTGRTLKRVTELIGDMGAAEVKTSVLLVKEGRQEVDLIPEFIGFRVPDKFVVGYGLDFAERYRNLPCIGTLRAELQNPPQWT